MEEIEPFLEMEYGFEQELERELIERNNITINLLAKRGYKLKNPYWNCLIAS